MKCGYDNEFAFQSCLFFAYIIIYFTTFQGVQFVASEELTQISQYVEKYDWQCLPPKLELMSNDHINVFSLLDHRWHCTLVQPVTFIIHNPTRLLSKSEVK